MEAIALSWFDVLISLIMMGGVIGLERLLRLGLGNDLLVGTARVFIQLYIVGFILKWVFAVNQPWIILLILLVMASIGGYNAAKRVGEISAINAVGATGAIIIGSTISVAIGCELVIGVRPWYNPQYIIPIAGMAMNGAMNGVALGVSSLRSNVRDNVERIECALAVGATGSQAIRPLVTEAIRRALIPTVNGLMTAGIVQIPGMMTGQIIAGLSPTMAVRYQILIYYMLALSSIVAAVAATFLYARRFFNPAHQLQRIWEQQKN